MISRLLPVHVIPVLLGLVAGSAIPDVSHADKPAPVLRTFGFLLLDESEAPPDFLGEESHALVVTEVTNDFVITILNEDLTELTTWLGADAQHAVQGGDPVGRYCWLTNDENPGTPSVGAHAFTGPEGSVESVEVVRIAPCGVSGCNYGDDYHWKITENGTHTFVIVSAWFSK